MIEIQFFDQDVNFARADATFKTDLDAQSPQSVYENDNDPGIQLTNSKTGQVISFPQNCHATQGPQNSTIWCELLVTPRVMIFVGVAPKGPSVDTDPPPGTDDFNHASDLLQAVFDQVRFAL